MATIDADHRYAELLTHIDFERWDLFVRGACHVIEQHTGRSEMITYVGLLQAKAEGIDLTELKWRTLIWELGAYADFIERLERATVPLHK